MYHLIVLLLDSFLGPILGKKNIFWKPNIKDAQKILWKELL
jgi:hypothetical protein